MFRQKRNCIVFNILWFLNKINYVTTFFQLSQIFLKTFFTTFSQHSHNFLSKKSCAIQSAEDDPDSVSDDDLAFWSFVREEDRPSTMRGVQEREDEEGRGDESGFSSDENIE